MDKQLIFHGKPIDVTLSKKAVSQSQQLESALLIEIQIYFSCLLGKRLAFYSSQAIEGTWQIEEELFSTLLENAQPLTDNLYLRFNTVMTKDCPVSNYIGAPPVTDFTIKNLKPYVPSWLNIDCINEIWSGEYGWPVTKPGHANTKQIRNNAILAKRN